MRRILACCLASLLGCGIAAANVVDFTGTAVGSWVNPTWDTGGTDYGSIQNQDAVDTATVQWGDQTEQGDPQDSLSFNGAGSDENGAPPDWYWNGTTTDPFLLGTVTYHNSPIRLYTGLLDVGLNVNVTVTDPAGFNKDFGFATSVEETLNPASDTVSILGPTPSQWTIPYGNGYLFEMLGFSLDGGRTFIDHVTLDESSTLQDINLYGRIKHIPDGGATALLLGLASVGLATVRRHLRR